MGMAEWFLARGVQRYKNSWANQDRKEMRRRMHFITELVLEGRRIQETHGTCHEGKWYVQSGIVIDMGIEAIITGDLQDLAMAIDMCSEKGFTWNYGEEHGPAVAAMYTKFHEMLTQAHQTWPSEEETAQA